MQKDFEKWNKKKISIDRIDSRPFFHEREIWFCFVGANVGFEQDGKGEDFLRPIVIARKFNNEIFWGIPLTKSKNKINKKAEKYYFSFSFIDKEEKGSGTFFYMLPVIILISLIFLKKISLVPQYVEHSMFNANTLVCINGDSHD